MNQSAKSINMEELLEIMDNDQELINDCFDEFVNEYKNMLKKIRFAIEEEDCQGLNKTAHKLKGSLRYLAAHPAAEIASRLEELGKKENLEESSKNFNILEDRCREVADFMKAYKS